jgi:hypothetical protein
MRHLGWIVKANTEKGLEQVSGPFATSAAATAFLEMYLKRYPESGAFVHERTLAGEPKTTSA